MVKKKPTTAFAENEISTKSQGGTEITKRNLAALIPEEISREFQVIPSRVREIINDKIRVYWVHDLPEDGEINHLQHQASRDRFHKIVFNSNWQLNDAIAKLGIPQDSKVDIIETGVEPIDLIEKPQSVVRLVYLSTPQRGLNLLLPVFDDLAQKYDNIHLDVFSSFKIYGWDDADKQFEPLYKIIREHPKMTYHGFASQAKIRKALQSAHILAYPCTWRETACRVLIESMSAGLMCVHPNLAALADTSGQLTSSYQFQSDESAHASIFHHYLGHAIENVRTEACQNYLRGVVKPYADLRFNITSVARRWTEMMQHLLQMYPKPESRLPAQEMFVYRT